MTNIITTTEKQKVLKKHLKTPKDHAKIAKATTRALRTHRDYSGIGRKIFLVDQTPDGVLPIYDKDPDVGAYFVGEKGDSIQFLGGSRRVLFPIFQLAFPLRIPLEQVCNDDPDILGYAQELDRSRIQPAEDVRVFAVMDGIATSDFDNLDVFNADIPVVGPLSTAYLIDAFAQIERHDLRIANILMNEVDYADISDVGDNFCDAKIIVDHQVPAGTVYVCGEPEMFGRIPMQVEPTLIFLAESILDSEIAFSMFENLGIGCHEPRGLCRLTITR